MTARVVNIVQARIGLRSRLPRKVLAEVGGLTLLQHHFWRMKRVVAINEVVVAIPEGADNDELAEYVLRKGWTLYRGPEEDVLARYAGAAVAHKADVVVRTTADCPLIDPGVVAGAVKLYGEGGFDYVSNNLERTFPHGLDVEVFSADALLRAHERATDPFEREHVSEWIRRHQDKPYRLGNLRFPIEEQPERFQKILREARITVDYPEDLLVVKAIFDFWASETKFITTADVLWLLDQVPEIMALNAHREAEHRALLTGAFEPMSEAQRKAWDARGEEEA